jgi:SAM-dependent methyltransferase
MSAIDEMKERSKAVWALGDYPAVARRFEGVAEDVVAAAGIARGDQVLDVAAGNGNVAIAAARAGGAVTASDFTPSLVVAGRERTAALGLDIRWDEADVEALPYDDDSFDAVVSVFGLMFAPRPEVAVAEVFRVLRPGGVVVLAAWTPEGWMGQMGAAMGPYMPAPPADAARPVDWGDEAIVRSRLARVAESLEFERGSVLWEFGSEAEALDWQDANFGVLVALRESLGDRYAEARASVVATIRRFNTATDGSVRIPAENLRVIARGRA